MAADFEDIKLDLGDAVYVIGHTYEETALTEDENNNCVNNKWLQELTPGKSNDGGTT